MSEIVLVNHDLPNKKMNNDILQRTLQEHRALHHNVNDRALIYRISFNITDRFDSKILPTPTRLMPIFVHIRCTQTQLPLDQIMITARHIG